VYSLRASLITFVKLLSSFFATRIALSKITLSSALKLSGWTHRGFSVSFATHLANAMLYYMHVLQLFNHLVSPLRLQSKKIFEYISGPILLPLSSSYLFQPGLLSIFPSSLRQLDGLVASRPDFFGIFDYRVNDFPSRYWVNRA